MAAIPSHATYTPPSSSPPGGTLSGRGDWDYSVPIDGRDDLNFTSQEQKADVVRNQNDKPGVASSIKSDPNSSAISQKINGYHSPPHSNEEYVPRSAGHSLEDDPDPSSDYLVAPKAPLLQRRDSTVSSNQDGDSVFDLYGGRMSVVSAYDVPLPNGNLEGYTNGNISSHAEPIEKKDPEASKWIHRDKLAKIEGNEAADYLYNLKTSRWIHKDKLERIEIEELHQAGINPSQTPPKHVNEDEELTQEKQLMPSPTISEGEHRADDDSNSADPADFDFDIRTPEERATDNKTADSSPRAVPHKQFRRNPSYSRIPVATISPHPIPQQYIERSTPLPRNPVTPNGSDDGRASISLPGARKRSHSAGSALLLDDSPATGTPTPGNAINNPKNYSRNPMSPTPGGRRSTASRTGSMAGKQRTRSNPQLNRPGTSASYTTHNGGTQGSAGKQPEGPPPWALQTYKPDPSLPPDQQIIPTLAKRMQQEQWERDGLYASVYDRELRPLKVHDNDNTEKGTQGDSTTEFNEEWPLKSTGSEFQPENKPKEESTLDGGYSTMPNVNGTTSTDPPPPRVVQKVPQVDDEEEKKRKFCCCVIM